MKKVFLVGFLTGIMLFFSGCFNENTNIVEKLKNKINKLDGYKISGTLEVTNNETTYQYDIQVDYEADEKYRVSLKNKTNDHEQIILKNSSGVYVLTPSLNKSFKFQSEWPYNNSQSYLYQTILNDIENDEDATIEEKDDGYIITTDVNYSNNKNLTKQKIYLDKDANITKVEVLNEKGITKIKMTYEKTDNNPSFEKDYFELSNNINQSTTTESKTTAEIDSIVYPLYIPENTTLETQDTIATENGERIILTFEGDTPFTLIEEPVSTNDENEVISVYGEIEFINDTIGSIADGTASWISNGTLYYAVSDSMDTEELLEVVNSVNVLPVGK
jgi:outer membrane lipoprotein-sorting protein